MTRRGRRLGCCSPGRFFAAEPGRPRSLGSGAGITGSILGGVGRCAPGVAPTIPRRSSPASTRARGRTGSALPTCCCAGCTPACCGGLNEQTGVGVLRTRRRCFRERVLLPALAPAARALLHSQSGPQAGMWLPAILADAATTLAPVLTHTSQ